MWKSGSYQDIKTSPPPHPHTHCLALSLSVWHIHVIHAMPLMRIILWCCGHWGAECEWVSYMIGLFVLENSFFRWDASMILCSDVTFNWVCKTLFAKQAWTSSSLFKSLTLNKKSCFTTLMVIKVFQTNKPPENSLAHCLLFTILNNIGIERYIFQYLFQVHLKNVFLNLSISSIYSSQEMMV